MPNRAHDHSVSACSELILTLRALPSQVQVFGACLGDAASACLIMELVPSGNLAERIYNPHKRRMSYLEILQVPPACPIPCCRAAVT